MPAKKGSLSNFETTWFNDALDVLNSEAKSWRNRREDELHQAENERHEQLAIAYKARVHEAFKSNKSKKLMVASLSFVTEIYEGKKYQKFEGTVFTAEEFKERVNFLFREHFENLLQAQLKIEAAEEKKLLEINAVMANAIAVWNNRQGDTDSGKGRGGKDKAKAQNKKLKARKGRKYFSMYGPQ